MGKQRLVVKVGTGVLTSDSTSLDEARMGDLVRQIATLRQSGHEVVLVSSGAVAAGRTRLALSRHRRDVPAKQMLAAAGQHVVMQTYDRLCAPFGITVAQTLLTKTDLRDRHGYLNARNTLIGLVEHGVLPIVNENDVVAVDEIHVGEHDRLFGENDNLAAVVASLVDAHLLVNLTNIGGLYTADPRHDPQAQIIREVMQITREIEALAGGRGTTQGTGGMRTKIDAAKLATASGITVVIAPGADPDVLLRIVRGDTVGTRFLPATSHRESRQRWILSALASKAALHVDAGAADAIRQRGRSLLAPGVRAVSGRFGRGAPVAVLDPAGQRIACGLVNYSAADLAQIKGQQSQDIASTLGYAFGDEVIHRSNMVLLNAPEE